MIYRGKKTAQIIVAGSADEFEKRLNKALAALDESETKYELTFNNNMGFCAYIVAEGVAQIAETVEDEFALMGECHKCGECPYWANPDNKRTKYTRCEITPGIHAATSPCCERFYEMLLNGDIVIGEEGSE